LHLQARMLSGLINLGHCTSCRGYFKQVVKQCALNKTRGYWLLSNALNVAITIFMKLRANYNHQVVQVPPLAYGTIDDELEILYGHMIVKKVGVLAPFLSFLESITIIGAHNKLALMLNSRFKGLKCVIDFFGHDKAKL
jgi:hypothetical protein